MKRGLMAALLILALVVIVLLFNRGRVDVNLILGTVSGLKSLVFLAFMGLGVVVGILLK